MGVVLETVKPLPTMTRRMPSPTPKQVNGPRFAVVKITNDNPDRAEIWMACILNRAKQPGIQPV